MNNYESILANGIGYLHHEIRYKNRPLIIDTRMVDGKYETISMRRNGDSFSCQVSDSPAIAAANHENAIRKFLPECLQKFPDDLSDCATQAWVEYGASEDGGTCNFDSPAVRFTGAHAGTVDAASSIVGAHCYRWQEKRKNPFYDYFVFSNPTGQGNRRSRIAERTAELLKERGYDTAVYYQMD